jgi:hypothetical protein
MDKEPDQLDRLLNEMFAAWKEDVDSVDVPILITDERAIEIVKAAANRPHVVRRLIGWVMDR